MLNVVSGGKQLTLDANGNLNINLAAGSISGGNIAASPTGAAVPAAADYGGINVAGSLVGRTGFLVGASVAASVAIVDGTGAQITSFGGGTQYADGTVNATPTGSVSLGKNPSNVLHALSLDASGNLNVLIANPSVAVTGAVSVSSVGGTVTVGGSVSVSNFPASQTVNQAVGSAIQILDSGGANKLGVDASGRIAISNFPGTQAITGTVAISNFPTGGSAVSIAGFTDPTVPDLLQMLVQETRAMKAAIVGMVTEAGDCLPDDFVATNFSDISTLGEIVGG